MWNETNPTSLYLGTTWELISAGKYVKTGDRALQTGGSNSITLTKDNMPNMKLKVDSFSVTLSLNIITLQLLQAVKMHLMQQYLTTSAGTNDGRFLHLQIQSK